MDLDRARIGIAADAAKRPEMMVERAVLLHQDDDVLNIANRSGSVVGLDSRRLGDVRFERTRRDGGQARQLQEFTAIHVAHDASVSSNGSENVSCASNAAQPSRTRLTGSCIDISCGLRCDELMMNAF